MPYKIEKQSSGGFKVKGTRRSLLDPYLNSKGGFTGTVGSNRFSNKSITKKQANRQRVAIALSESRKTGKPVGYYFK